VPSDITKKFLSESSRVGAALGIVRRTIFGDAAATGILAISFYIKFDHPIGEFFVRRREGENYPVTPL
jgi:hypothetical protein